MVDRRLSRFDQLHRVGRWSGVLAAVLLGVMGFGLLVSTTTAEWAWPPQVLPLLMAVFVIVALTFVMVEVGHRAVDYMIARA